VPRQLSLALGFVCLLVLPLAPAVVLAPLGLGRGTGTWALAAVACSLATILVTPGLGARAGAALAVATTLGFLAAPTPWAAAIVMAAGAALYGRSSRWGVSSAIVVAPIALGFVMTDRVSVVESASDLHNAAVVGGITLVASLWGVLVGWILGRKVPRKALEPVPARQATTFAVVMAVVSGVTMWVVSALELGHTGGWVLATLFVMIQPSTGDTWSRTLHRLLGTLLGFVIALVAGVLIGAAWAHYLIALACMVTAAVIRLTPERPYWQYATFLTPAVVLAAGAGGAVLDVDRARLGATLAGGVISIALVAAIRGLSAWTERDAPAAPAGGPPGRLDPP